MIDERRLCSPKVVEEGDDDETSFEKMDLGFDDKKEAAGSWKDGKSCPEVDDRKALEERFLLIEKTIVIE